MTKPTLYQERENRGLYTTVDLVGILLSKWRLCMVKRLLDPARKQLVDLACGDNRLVSRLGFGIGVDILDYGNVDLVATNFEQLPLPSSSVDYVTIIAALNYFENPSGVLKEVSRIMRSDGVLLVTLLDARVSRLWHKLRDRRLKRTAYSKEELVELLSASGLVVASATKFMFGLNNIYLIKKENQINGAQ